LPASARAAHHIDGAQDENGQGNRDQRSRIALQVLALSPIGNKLLVPDLPEARQLFSVDVDPPAVALPLVAVPGGLGVLSHQVIQRSAAA